MLIDSAPLFNYPIELKADGLVDSPLSDLRVPERLKILLQRREAWRELNWTKRVPLSSSDTIVTYELVGGVFGTLLPSKEERRNKVPPRPRGGLATGNPDRRQVKLLLHICLRPPGKKM